MAQGERWLLPILRTGLEARIDAPDGEQRVIVYVDDAGAVQWTPVADTYFPDDLPHQFRFWVHAESDPEHLQAIQFLATRLQDAGHTVELVTTSTH
jgi:hypothetical protein